MKRIFLIGFLLLAARVQARQWLIFFADNSTLTGHVFVSFIKEEPLLRQTLVVGCWGFYPSKGVGVFGDVPGEIRDDWKRQRTLGFMLAVTPDEFDQCLAVRNRWHSRRYNLRRNNCIDFLRDVAAEIPRIDLGPGKLILPIDFVRQLKARNKKLEFTDGFGYPFKRATVISGGPQLLPALSFALTTIDRGEIVLKGKFARNLSVTLLTPGGGALVTETGRDSWIGNIAANRLVTRLVHQPGGKADEAIANQSVAVINFDNAAPVKLVASHTVSSAVTVDRVVRVAAAAGLPGSLLKINAGNQNDALLRTYQELLNRNRPVVNQVDIPGRMVYIISYRLDVRTTGPQVLIEGNKAYPLTGQCSQPRYLVFAIGNRYFLRAGSFCCECGINADQLFELAPGGVKTLLNDPGRSD